MNNLKKPINMANSSVDLINAALKIQGKIIKLKTAEEKNGCREPILSYLNFVDNNVQAKFLEKKCTMAYLSEVITKLEEMEKTEQH